MGDSAGGRTLIRGAVCACSTPSLTDRGEPSRSSGRRLFGLSARIRYPVHVIRIGLMIVCVAALLPGCRIGYDLLPDDQEGGGSNGGGPGSAVNSGEGDSSVANGGNTATGGLTAGSDSGGPDSGGPDSGRLDSGRPDSGRLDSGATDSGAPDTGGSDAGGSDSAATDSGGADSGDSGGSSEPCLDAIFCDGFEDGDLTTNWDGPSASSGSVATSADSPRTGTWKLEASIDTGGGFAYATKQDFGSRTSGAVHARAFYFVPSGPALDELDIMFVTEPAGPFHGVRVRVLGGNLTLRSQPGDVTSAGGIPIPRDVWTCIEMAITIGETDGAATLEMDGALVASFTNEDTLPALGLATVEVGIVRSNAGVQGPASLGVDDVVISTQPIGCD